MKRTAFATIVGLLLSGCTLGPDYLRPKILIPDNHRGSSKRRQAESLADLPWWELFRDPVLQELTREALNNNYDLRIAAARVEEARAQIGITRSFLYPQVNLNGSGSVQQVSRASEPPQSFGADRTFQKLALGLRPGVGARCLRQNPARNGSGDRGFSCHGAGAARRLDHFSGRRRPVLFHFARAGSGTGNKPAHLEGQ